MNILQRNYIVTGNVQFITVTYFINLYTMLSNMTEYKGTVSVISSDPPCKKDNV